MIRVLRLFLPLLVLGALGGTPAQAGDAPAVTTCIARMDAGQDARALIGKPGALDCDAAQHELGSGDFVVALRFAPVEARPNDDLSLYFQAYWLKSARFHFLYADGREDVRDLSARQLTQYARIAGGWQMPVPERDAALTDVFVELRGVVNTRGILVNSQLLTRHEASKATNLHTAVLAAVAGLMFALFFYSGMLLVVLDPRFLRQYGMMAFAFVAYGLSVSGMLAIAMPDIDNRDIMRISYLECGFLAFSIVEFFRSFYGRDPIGPWQRNLQRLAGYGSLGVGGSIFLLAPWQFPLLDQIFQVAILAALAVVQLLFVTAWRLHRPKIRLLFLASASPMIFTVLLFYHFFEFLHYDYGFTYGVFAAMLVLAVSAAIQLTARVYGLQSERDEAREGEKRASRLADLDPLTGLYNRRAFTRLMVRGDCRYRLMLIDIDHFKQINDTYGHEVGDQVIAAVSEAIRSCQPARALSARFGGDEFALAIAESQTAECTADMILEAIRHHPMPYGVKVTVSIGYGGGKVDSAETMQWLYRVADAALYRAKSDGRDTAAKALDLRVVA